jgi:hypothetical protein
LFASGSITLAKCSVAGYVALIIVQCVWHGFGLYC